MCVMGVQHTYCSAIYSSTWITNNNEKNVLLVLTYERLQEYRKHTKKQNDHNLT